MNRSLQSKWFKTWCWLHYDQSRGLVFCHTCVQAANSEKMMSGTVDLAYIACDYFNWEDASGERGAFDGNEHSQTCCGACIHNSKHNPGCRGIALNCTCPGKKANRQHCLKITQNVTFFSKAKCDTSWA